MNPTEKLRECPFCGGEAKLRSWEWPYERYQVRCTKCRAKGRSRFATVEAALAAWNTRTPDERLVEALEVILASEAISTSNRKLAREALAAIRNKGEGPL